MNVVVWFFQPHSYQSNHNDAHNLTSNQHQSTIAYKGNANKFCNDANLALFAIKKAFQRPFVRNANNPNPTVTNELTASSRPTVLQMQGQYFPDGYPACNRLSLSEHPFYFSYDLRMRCLLN